MEGEERGRKAELPTPPFGVSLTASPTLVGICSCSSRAPEDALDVTTRVGKSIFTKLGVDVAETLGIESIRSRHRVGSVA